MKTSCISIWILITIASVTSVFSQNYRIKFDKISQELTQSTVTCILQDYHGFIWLGTMDGLNRYDGYQVKQYRHRLQETGTLPDNVVQALLEDKHKKMWVGTRNGLAVFDKIRGDFLSIPNPFAIANAGNSINCLFEEGNEIWVGTNAGLFFYNFHTKKWRKSPTWFPEQLQHGVVATLTGTKGVFCGVKDELFRVNTKLGTVDSLVLPSKHNQHIFISDILTDENSVWLASNAGLWQVNKTDFKVVAHHTHNLKIEHSLSSNQLTCLVKGDDDILWVGTVKSGLNRFFVNRKKFIRYQHQDNDKHSLSTNGIQSAFLDKTGILWVGTSLGGVNKWSRMVEGMEVFRHNPYEPASISSNQIRTFYQDNTNNFWVGTVDAGLNYWNTEKNTFQHFQHEHDRKSSLSHNHVRSIVEDYMSRIWVATDGGGLNLKITNSEAFKRIRFSKKQTGELPFDRIWKIIQTKDSALWLASFGGGLIRYVPEKNEIEHFANTPDDNTSLGSNLVTTIYEDSKKRIWVGTYGGGLCLYNPVEQKFTRFQFQPDNNASIGNNRVYSIREDADGNLWVGTKGSLNVWHGKNNKFTRFDESDGLPNDVILGILQGDLGYLWLSTNKGLCKFHPKTHEVRVYDRRDGLQHNEFLVGAALRARSGELLFGGINGYNTFFPTSIRENKIIPKVMLTKFEVFNRDFILDTVITDKKHIELTWQQNFINLEFVALNYIHPEKNKYKFFLEGKDRDTVYSDFRRATYTDLEPGSYVFTVKASNNDGVWNEEGTSVRIVIRPAFWQTYTFKAIGIIVFFGMLLFFYHRRITRIQRQKKILENEVAARTEYIVQQKTDLEVKNKAIVDQHHEIEMQAEELRVQRDVLEEHRDHILLQKQEITDSIRYAERIQMAVMSAKDVLQAELAQHFVLFKPKDIVSGDFYWAAALKQHVVVVAADCTGHGVPGAFMSMLGISFLDRIVKEKKVVEPHLILNMLRQNIIDALHQDNVDSNTKDGMDMTILVVDKEQHTVRFAGANNPLYLLRNNAIEIYKTDKMPVGYYENMHSFSDYSMNLQAGDVFYMFSDGYADQFGGESGKKLKYKAFREHLLHQNTNLTIVGEALESLLAEWRNHPSGTAEEYEQTDDILVLGLQFL